MRCEKTEARRGSGSHRLRGAALAIAALLLVGALPVAGQDATPATGDLQGIQQSLDRMTVILERLVESRQVDLLLKRIELKERRLIPMEKELRDLRSRYSDSEAEIEAMVSMMEEWEKQKREAELTSNEDEVSALEEMHRQITAGIEREKSRRDGIDIEMRELEAEIDQQRRNLNYLDDLLEERLEED